MFVTLANTLTQKYVTKVLQPETADRNYMSAVE